MRNDQPTSPLHNVQIIGIPIFCTYNILMGISFDPNKELANLRKHGTSLANAARIEWETAIEKLDERDDYGEDRYIVLGFIGIQLYCVVYVDRNDERRVISLRKASAKEVEAYVRANQ